MSEPQGRVCHVDDAIPGAVYVGRGSKRKRRKPSIWGNPFVIGTDGSRMGVVASYDQLLHDRLFFGDVAEPEYDGVNWTEEIIKLRDAPGLECHCRHRGEPMTHENACHADCINGVLNDYTDEELRMRAPTKDREA